ncbi:asparagine synthase (glutamine-hydrolyzing) [Phenylobacterium sp.]|jgi:asparagine synthase (glutamine-hydrolysing)|uniref:asparagine synthase (glutamine-hydrolyzing) n=1 Tax=Phenylobacterium sp. TaxID=1871053 RepID=UPI002F9491E9
MCGIAGLLTLRAIAREDVSRMIHPLEHRGPDGHEIWLDEPAGIGLAHSRLAIIDVSPTGAQPMVSRSGRFVITYNGEIYNSTELRAEVQRTSGEQEWRGHSDTEVLLAAIDQWGAEAALMKAEGMFAFALWDRSSRKLLLARDRSGEKPLYYGFAADAFVFGSELKALRTARGFEADIDYAAATRFLQLSYVPAPYSIYRNARKLTAGSFIEVRAEDIAARRWPEPRPYWDIRRIADAGSAEPIHDEALAIEMLDETLRRAVKSQMSADVPLGAFLSGGIDSSTVVAMMQDQSATPVTTFTVGFGDPGYDESMVADRVARFLGTDHHELHVTPAEAQAVVPLLGRIYDEPFADASQIPTYLIAKLARTRVTVALSGDGGDELFAGYNRHLWLPALLRMTSKLPPVVAEILATGVDMAPAVAIQAAAKMRGPLGQAARRAEALPSILRAQSADAAYRGAIHNWAVPPLAVELKHSCIELAEPELRPGSDVHSNMMLWDYLTYLPDDVLTKVDRASMRASLEVRCPLLHSEVAALAWRLPLHMKLRGSTGKWLLRQVLYRYVPQTIVNQPKAGFSAPIGSWIRGPLREWAGDLLSESRIRRQGLFDVKAVGAAWREHQLGKRDLSKKLWPVLMFAAWSDEWCPTLSS